MIDVKKEIVNVLKKLNANFCYELFIDDKCKIPCISYLELDNSEKIGSVDFSYSDLEFQFKVWDYSIENVSKLSNDLDLELKKIGFKRTFATEIIDKKMVIKILRYVATGYEYRK